MILRSLVIFRVLPSETKSTSTCPSLRQFYYTFSFSSMEWHCRSWAGLSERRLDEQHAARFEEPSCLRTECLQLLTHRPTILPSTASARLHVACVLNRDTMLTRSTSHNFDIRFSSLTQALTINLGNSLTKILYVCQMIYQVTLPSLRPLTRPRLLQPVSVAFETKYCGFWYFCIAHTPPVFVDHCIVRRCHGGAPGRLVGSRALLLLRRGAFSSRALQTSSV